MWSSSTVLDLFEEMASDSPLFDLFSGRKRGNICKRDFCEETVELRQHFHLSFLGGTGGRQAGRQGAHFGAKGSHARRREGRAEGGKGN